MHSESVSKRVRKKILLELLVYGRKKEESEWFCPLKIEPCCWYAGIVHTGTLVRIWPWWHVRLWLWNISYFWVPIQHRWSHREPWKVWGVILLSAAQLLADAHRVVLCLGARKTPGMSLDAAVGRWGRTADTCTQSRRLEKLQHQCLLSGDSWDTDRLLEYGAKVLHSSVNTLKSL